MKKGTLVFAIMLILTACSSTSDYHDESLDKKYLSEDWVRLSFDITEVGTTENIKVLDSSLPESFHPSAIQAVPKYKYKPKIVSGNSVKQIGQEVRLDFKSVGDGG